MQKTPYVFPIIGGRKVEHLMDNIEALDISLSTEQIKYLEGIIPFDLGFPHSMIVRLFLMEDEDVSETLILQGDGTAYVNLSLMAGVFDRWPLPEAIRPQN